MEPEFPRDVVPVPSTNAPEEPMPAAPVLITITPLIPDFPVAVLNRTAPLLVAELLPEIIDTRPPVPD